MKTLLMTAFAVLSLSAAIVPVANAAGWHDGSAIAGDYQATRNQQLDGSFGH